MTYHPDALDRRDPRLIARVRQPMEIFAKHYLRLRSEGLDHVPKGPVMFVANHNGGIMGPDLFCTLPVLWRALGEKSPLYALAHDFPMRQITPLGRILQRFGAISANRANARRVLSSGGQLLVYPGGDLDAYRHSAHRDRVIILPRTGFIEVARESGAPIVPVVTQGAHRSAYIFSEGRSIARVFRMREWARVEKFPLALALPWGLAPGPWLPYLPLPFRIRLRILPPIWIAPKDDATKTARHVEESMQRAVNELAR